MFRAATSKDIDAIHQVLVDEASQCHFDRRLAEEPYRSGLRKNLNNIRKRGRRLDEDLAAQLLVWETGEGEAAGCLINSAIVSDLGNEIWMIAVWPRFRGQGIATAMQTEVLKHLHPRVDVFSRCAPEARVFYEMNLRRGFLPLEVTEQGVSILKLPKMGAALAGQDARHQQLEPFVEIPLRRR